VNYPHSQLEKAAALLLCMDKPLASRVIKYFDDSELKFIAEAASRLGALPQTRIDELVDEFASAFASGSDIQGNPQSTAQLLEGLVPPDRLSNLMTDIAGNSSSRVWALLPNVGETALSQYLAKQPPQVITFILSRLTGNLSALVLEQLPVAQRVDVVRRMLSLREVSPIPLQLLELNIQAELVSKSARNSAPDVHARIASVLNKMTRENADATFAGLSTSRPKDAEKIKGLLFTFNDIAKLSEDARTKLFENIPVETTIASLHGADAALRDLIMSVLSQRGRRMIEVELESGRVPPKSEIAKAQRTVAERALELVERGVIEIGGEG
jgi:flagellar motor switch protein FliG